MIDILAALSASAAAGIRIALPLLFIGLLQGSSLWSEVPLLSQVSTPLLLFLLTSWSVVEIFASKKLLGQRVLQVFHLLLAPLVGAIMGVGCCKCDIYTKLVDCAYWWFFSLRASTSPNRLVLPIARHTIVGCLYSRCFVCCFGIFCLGCSYTRRINCFDSFMVCCS
jgi:hypothetical protein